MLKRMLLSTAAVLMIAAPVLAQMSEQPATGRNPQMPPPPAAAAPAAPTAPASASGEILPIEAPSQMRAETLIGKKVVNDGGEQLGTVEDIVLNEDGTVSGLVIKTGGVMGFGGKAVAIAWRDVGSAMHSEAVAVPLSKDQLERAPAFSTKEEQAGKAAVPRLPDD